MKLELINCLSMGNAETWRNLSVLKVTEGVSPSDASKTGIDRDEWEGAVLRAAEEQGIHIASSSSGVPGHRYANAPVIDWWEHGAPVTTSKPAFITIAQSGGLDI